MNWPVLPVSESDWQRTSRSVVWLRWNRAVALSIPLGGISALWQYLQFGGDREFKATSGYIVAVKRIISLQTWQRRAQIHVEKKKTGIEKHRGLGAERQNYHKLSLLTCYSFTAVYCGWHSSFHFTRKTSIYCPLRWWGLGIISNTIWKPLVDRWCSFR